MSDFLKAMKVAAGNEGEISKDRNDSGNYFEVGSDKRFVATRYGQTFENWLTYSRKKIPTTSGEFEALKNEFESVTEIDVQNSFKEQYWDKYNLDSVENDDVASNIFDAMINQTYTLGGPGTHETLSDVLNSLGYDTTKNDFPTVQSAIDAVNKAVLEKGEVDFNAAYADRREESYMGSKTVDKHGKGWLKRINQFRPDEDQYSNSELDNMSFTNDSTSNIAVLNEIKKIKIDESSPVNVDSEVETSSEEFRLDDSPLLKTIDTEGVPTLSDAQKDERYARDISSRPLQRKEAIDKFRKEFIALSKTDPRKKSMGGTGEGGVENIGAFDKKMQQLILDNPIAVLFSDNWDGEKETLMLTEDFFKNKSTSFQKGILENLTKDRLSYSKLFDKIYDDSIFLEEGEIFNKLNEVQENENNPPELNILSTANGKTTVKLSDGRTVTVDENEELINRSLVFDETKTPEDLKLEEAEYIEKVKEGTATQQERDDAVKRNQDRLDSAIKKYSTPLTEKEKRQQAKNENQKRRLRKKEGTLTDEDETFYDERRGKLMEGAQAALSGLKAAAGAISLSKALQNNNIDTPELSPLINEAVNKQRELAKSGLNSSEKAAAMTNINNAYSSAMKNVLRASGGQRGTFLANQGVVDANRVGALIDLAGKDATIRRQNIGQFNQLASSVGQMQLNRDMTVEQMRQQTLAQNKTMLGNIGTNLISGALDDASYYLNPNKKAMEEMTRNITNMMGNNSNYIPDTDATITQANKTTPNQED